MSFLQRSAINLARRAPVRAIAKRPFASSATRCELFFFYFFLSFPPTTWFNWTSIGLSGLAYVFNHYTTMFKVNGIMLMSANAFFFFFFFFLPQSIRSTTIPSQRARSFLLMVSRRSRLSYLSTTFPFAALNFP